MGDPKLASEWRASRVESCLTSRDKPHIVEFLTRRHDERFFRPIHLLAKSSGNEQGYGFAVMALCSLLIETIQCYRFGLPTTNPSELNDLSKYRPPAKYEIPRNERRNGSEVFKSFFVEHRGLFPNVDADQFRKNIRNGLLHQAQTKDGWTINTRRSKVCDPIRKVIDRGLFAKALEDAFVDYLKDLQRQDWKDDIWQKAERKIWWLIQLSR